MNMRSLGAFVRFKSGFAFHKEIMKSSICEVDIASKESSIKKEYYDRLGSGLKIVIPIYFVWCLSVVKCADFLDPMKHDVQVFNVKNFDSKVKVFRQHAVFLIYGFYSSDNRFRTSIKPFILGELNSAASELKGMIVVGIVDCSDWDDFCKQSMVKSTPVLLIYPPSPFPPFAYEGPMLKNDIVKKSLTLIPGENVAMVSKDNIDNFLTENPAIPKVLLFSEKTKPPALYNALSNSFIKKLSMGFVSVGKGGQSAEATLVRRWKKGHSQFPYLVLLRIGENKHHEYSGPIKFRDIHDWLNVFSETFVSGGGYSDSDTTVTSQPWLIQKIPEITKASYNDLCFGKGKGLCVIYLKNGEKITNNEITMLEELSDEFTPHVSDRGINFRWMWMDVGIEKNFANLFGISNFPSLVVFNPFKRLRYTKLEDVEATKETIKHELNKIAGGDGKFTNVPGQKLPEFANRETAQKPRRKHEEF